MSTRGRWRRAGGVEPPRPEHDSPSVNALTPRGTAVQATDPTGCGECHRPGTTRPYAPHLGAPQRGSSTCGPSPWGWTALGLEVLTPGARARSLGHPPGSSIPKQPPSEAGYLPGARLSTRANPLASALQEGGRSRSPVIQRQGRLHAVPLQMLPCQPPWGAHARCLLRAHGLDLWARWVVSASAWSVTIRPPPPWQGGALPA